MTLELAKDIIVDSLLDSIKVFVIALAFYIILSFIEDKLSHRLDKKHKSAPLFGSLAGLVPQCGISVVAADLYVKEHITTGTLLAIFIACSDEALPIMFSSKNTILMGLLLVGIKFALGFIIGFTVDLLYRKSIVRVHNHEENCQHEEEIHIGCCHHEIDNSDEGNINKHLLHPIIHSLKLFAYVLAINLIFGFLIGFIGEENIISFLESNKYLAPLFTTLIGLIPNCASSVIITELYLLGGIGFGALISGLVVNAGLGIFYLAKEEKNKKKVILIIALLITIALIGGYITSLILNFK